jgi:hypothetical protein
VKEGDLSFLSVEVAAVMAAGGRNRGDELVGPTTELLVDGDQVHLSKVPQGSVSPGATGRSMEVAAQWRSDCRGVLLEWKR